MLKTTQTYSFFFSFMLIIFFSESLSAQFTIPEKPKDVSEQTSLYDYINLLSSSQQSALESKLIRYADSTSTQIVVAIISTSKGEDLSLLGAKWGQKWGIGQADKDNGILVILAKDDRKIDINTGYGIEYRLTDLMAERIINRVMIPEFKSGDYYAGLDKGSDAIFAALNGEFNEERDFTEDGYDPTPIIIIVIFLIILIALSAKKNGRGGRGGRKGSSLLDIIILSNMGRTGGFGGSSGGFGGSSGGGSFGGGGFGGGFGGGSFGGGGAGGSW